MHRVARHDVDGDGRPVGTASAMEDGRAAGALRFSRWRVIFRFENGQAQDVDYLDDQ